MANPKLPGISESEQALLYAKLNEYNRGRASLKRQGFIWWCCPDRESPTIPFGSTLPARKAIDSLYTRFISGYQRVPADSKHHVLLFATVPHPDGLQREENAEQR